MRAPAITCLGQTILNPLLLIVSFRLESAPTTTAHDKQPGLEYWLGS